GWAGWMVARRSAPGNGEEVGWGVAPSFHAAIVASKKPMQLGKPIVTSEFGVTPTSWYTRASRLVGISNSARVIVTSSHVSAGALGADRASCPITTPKGVWGSLWVECVAIRSSVTESAPRGALRCGIVDDLPPPVNVSRNTRGLTRSNSHGTLVVLPPFPFPPLGIRWSLPRSRIPADTNDHEEDRA